MISDQTLMLLLLALALVLSVIFAGSRANAAQQPPPGSGCRVG